MAVGRTCLITGAFVNAQQVPYANQPVTFRLKVPGGQTPLLVYQVAADPADGEIVTQTDFTQNLDANGTLGAGIPLTAPQDVQVNYGGVLSAAAAYYEVSAPGGLLITTTNFAYSGSARDIGVVNSQSAPVAYPTVNVTFAVVTPQQAGNAQLVTATLSVDCYVATTGSPIVQAQTPFQTTLASNGTGTLALIANSVLRPVNANLSARAVYWTIRIGNGPSFPIQVPNGGGAATSMVVNVVNGLVVATPRSLFADNFSQFL